MPGPLSLPLDPLLRMLRFTHTARFAASCFVLAAASLSPISALAQEEAFLSCADFNDRAARVTCLEDALSDAVAAREARESPPAPAAIPAAQPAATVVQQPPAPPAPTAATAATTAPPPSAAQTVAPPTAVEEDRSRLLDVFGWFGRDRNDGEEDAPEIAEMMQATVTGLEVFKPDRWTITLDNGQVWRQLYTDRYNLREGDAVTISRATGRLQYRLEAERFNGFIQVERVR
jgi:hypothetical protein